MKAPKRSAQDGPIRNVCHPLINTMLGLRLKYLVPKGIKWMRVTPGFLGSKVACKGPAWRLALKRLMGESRSLPFKSNSFHSDYSPSLGIKELYSFLKD